MDNALAYRLSELTGEFYAQVAESFSATRQTPWAGWQRLYEQCSLGRGAELRICDLACGNLRFERFVSEKRMAAGIAGGLQVFAFDNCDALEADAHIDHAHVLYTHADVAEILYEGSDLRRVLGDSVCDVAVCFGFMHHLALGSWRERVLEALLSCVEPGGFVAVSFWQLSQSEKLLDKARAFTEIAAPELGVYGLGAGDYLLGWQSRTDVARYCHDFSEEEIDGLVAGVEDMAREVTRFSADGATGNLNRYVVLRRYR